MVGFSPLIYLKCAGVRYLVPPVLRYFKNHTSNMLDVNTPIRCTVNLENAVTKPVKVFLDPKLDPRRGAGI